MSKKKQDEAMGIEPSKVDLMKHERYASALRRFNKLTWAKNEFAEKKQKLVIQCARVGEDARQYVARESRCLPSLTTDEINAQAKILAYARPRQAMSAPSRCEFGAPTGAEQLQGSAEGTARSRAGKWPVSG